MMVLLLLMLLLLPLLPENGPNVVPPLTSQATEAAAAAAFSFSLRDDPPKRASSKFARGGSVSEKERAACASDFAAAEADDDEDKARAVVRWEASEARGEESGRRTPQPEKRSYVLFFQVLFRVFRKKGARFFIGLKPTRTLLIAADTMEQSKKIMQSKTKQSKASQERMTLKPN